MRHPRHGQATAAAGAYQYTYALRVALDLPVQRLAHLNRQTADPHDIIDCGSTAVISGRYAGYCSG